MRTTLSRLGEVLAWRNLFWGLSDAAARNPVPWRGNAVLPNPDYCMAYRWFSQVAYARVREIVLQDVASGLIYLPSSAQETTRTPESSCCAAKARHPARLAGGPGAGASFLGVVAAHVLA
jgi:aromatic ring hydroxylase